MKRPNEYSTSSGATNQGWLPSQNWEEIAKKRQEKIAVAEAERAYKNRLLKRHVMLAIFVIGTIAVVTPTAIYPRFAQADDLDAAMGYTLAQEARVTFGGRLDNADPIVSNGDEFLSEVVPVADQQQAPEQEEQQQQQGPVVFEDADDFIPSDGTLSGQSTDPAPAPQAYMPIESRLDEPSAPLETYVDEPAPPQAEQVSAQAESTTPVAQPASAVHGQESSPQSQQQASTSSELVWYSVPSWSTASAPQRDALGIWDTHYYIAHNWTSYGEVILGLRNGDVLTIDGQRLVVIDSDYFSAGTDYETVRARFGWDAWCLQTCYGESQVRIVSLKPIS